MAEERPASVQDCFPKMRLIIPAGQPSEISADNMALLRRMANADGYNSIDRLLNDMIQVWVKNIHPSWQICFGDDEDGHPTETPDVFDDLEKA